MPKMSVECASVFILIHQLADIPQITPELFRSHCGVVPALPLCWCTGSKRSRTRPGLSYLPHLTSFTLRIQPGARRLADMFQTIDELQGNAARLVRIISPKFHQQYPAAFGKEFQIRRSFPPKSVDYASFKALQSDRMEGFEGGIVDGLRRKGAPNLELLPEGRG